MKWKEAKAERDAAKRALIERHLAAADGVVHKAAKSLDVAPSTLRSAIARLGITHKAEGETK